jgi:transcriptional regulator with XRE-family HTH domain
MPKRRKSEEIKRIKDIRLKIMAHYNIVFIQDYAKKLGYTKQAYYKVENNGSNANFLVSLNKAFGVPADSILHGTKCYLD